MTSLLREEMPVPMAPAASATITSWPRSAAARAAASPITPAPTTRICMKQPENWCRHPRLDPRIPLRLAQPCPRNRDGRTSRAKTVLRTFCPAMTITILERTLFRREPHFRRGGTHVGIDVALEGGEILLKHADELARGVLEFGLVGPRLRWMQNMRLHARHRGRHLEAEIGIGAELRLVQAAVERGGQQRARHLDRHAAADAVNAAGPAGVHQPAVHLVGRDHVAEQIGINRGMPRQERRAE